MHKANAVGDVDAGGVAEEVVVNAEEVADEDRARTCLHFGPTRSLEPHSTVLGKQT